MVKEGKLIECREISGSKTVRSFINTKLKQWIKGRGINEASTHYHVILDREGGGHQVSCEIEVIAGSERWTGSWEGSGLHQAFMQALNHMMHGHKPANDPGVPGLRGQLPLRILAPA